MGATLIEESLKETAKVTQIHLNMLSAVCGLTVVVIIGIMGLFDRKLIDRVSIRFTTAISLVDFIKALVMMEYSKGGQIGAQCLALAFFIQFLTLLYMFLNVVIAINLHLVFVRGLTFDPRWERIYWLLSTFLAFFFASLPLVAGRYGLTSKRRGVCEYENFTTSESCIWISATYLFWIFASIVYCTIVVVLTIMTLYKKVTILDKMASNTNNNTCNPFNLQQSNPKEILKNTETVKRDLKKLIRRVALYCIIPAITQVWFLMARGGKCFEYDNDSIRNLSIITTDLPGFLNLLVLLIDPAFTNAVSNMVKSHWPYLKQKLWYFAPSRFNPSHRHCGMTGGVAMTTNLGPGSEGGTIDGGERGLIVHGKFSNLSDKSSLSSFKFSNSMTNTSPDPTLKQSETMIESTSNDDIALVLTKESAEENAVNTAPHSLFLDPSGIRSVTKKKKISKHYSQQFFISNHSSPPISSVNARTKSGSLIQLSELIEAKKTINHSQFSLQPPSEIVLNINNSALLRSDDLHEDQDRQLNEFIRSL